MSLTYALIIFAILLILIFFGVPIAYSIELSVVALLVITHLKPLILIPQKLEIGMDTFVYLAIPLFTLAGYLMEQGGQPPDFWPREGPWDRLFHRALR